VSRRQCRANREPGSALLINAANPAALDEAEVANGNQQRQMCIWIAAGAVRIRRRNLAIVDARPGVDRRSCGDDRVQRDAASHARCVMSIAMVARPLELLQRFGPYLLVEAVMPGGTLLALLLYLYRARRGL